MGKFCSNCGNEVNENAYACLSCGYKIKQESNKSKLVAGLLGILFGSLGVHNFYLGYTGKGIAQLLLTLLSFGLLFIVSYVWGLVEGIMILTGSIETDAKGNELKE